MDDHEKMWRIGSVGVYHVAVVLFCVDWFN